MVTGAAGGIFCASIEHALLRLRPAASLRFRSVAEYLTNPLTLKDILNRKGSAAAMQVR
jgi:hypothetical protein